MKTILITGGSGKVGFQLVNNFLALNFKVITTTRNKELFLNKKRNQLHENHEALLDTLEVDFTEKNAYNTIIHFLKVNEIMVQDIIHNARTLDYMKLEEDKSISEENFAGEYFMNFIFPYKLTMEILKVPNKLDNIIFISSMYGVVAPTPSLYEDFHKSSAIHYGVSKAAQIHLTKELAVRLSPDIRVNCVSFGGNKGRTDEEFQKRYHELTPLGKMLEEEDVVGPVDYLVSEKSRNMTGQNIVVDGGWTVW